MPSAALASTPKPEMQTAPVDGTKEMAELLQSIARGIEPRELSFAINEERATWLREMMGITPDPSRRELLRQPYSVELLRAGRTEMALEEFTRIEQWMRSTNPALWKKARHTLRLLQATAYLRLGEQQNCCARNTSDSCLLPIRGHGIHTRKIGSTRAMEVLEGILQEHPEDQLARWLLNVAAMTLGIYPGGVPEKWRIPPTFLQSDADIQRFPNIASDVGLNLLGLAGGAVVEDLDGDGYLDVMVSGLGFQDQLRFFRNNGDATFTERTKESKLIGETGGLNMIHADYNNDGHPDILLLRGGWMGTAAHFPSSLLRNNGDGTFTDVSKQAGLMRAGPTQAAVWLDYNNDGWLDLYVGYESSQRNIQLCALYRNNGDGTFTDVAQQAGVNQSGFVKGVVSADYDNDGWPDLFLSGMRQKTLYRNNGDGTFRDVTAISGIARPLRSFGTFFFDYDNDGWADLFVMDYDVSNPTNAIMDIQRLPVKGDHSHLYRNNRDGTFADVTEATRLNRVILGMGLNFGDLDNDGYLDFYAGTGNPELTTLIPNRMFRNAGGKFFQEVTTSGNFGHLQKGHGIAFADINNDGNQDVFAQMGAAYSGDTAFSSLYANPGHGNQWLTLKLEGVQTNRCAIGARIKVTVRTASGTRSIYKTVGSGGSFGCNPLRQEIGLGQAQEIETVAIYWPVSRKTQTLRGLQRNRFYQVREDEEQATPFHLEATPWSAATAGVAR
jgi:hypothetical protein